MSSRNLTWPVALALLAIAGTAPAECGSPTLLNGTPTADVLPVGAVAVSVDASFAGGAGTGQREENASLSLSPCRNLDVGVTAYTRADYVLDVKYQLLTGRSGRLGVAVGVCDLGVNGYVSPVGHGQANVWPNWMYQQDGVSQRPYENSSVFVVASYRATPTIRLHAGLGRGRFVGYGQRSRYLNTDILFRGYHQWAIGLFGGAEVVVLPRVALVGEMSGRDLNAGVRASYGGVTATVAWTKLECLLFSMGSTGRLAVDLSYGFQNWSGVSGLFRRQRAAATSVTAKLPVTECSASQDAAACPGGAGFDPVLFDWDSWQITRAAAASLSRSVALLRNRPQTVLVITGYACEGGSPEANTMLAGKRALAAFEFLKAQGVPGRRMSYRARIATSAMPLPLQRAVRLDTESGD
jgi:hypothetical protein